MDLRYKILNAKDKKEANLLKSEIEQIIAKAKERCIKDIDRINPLEIGMNDGLGEKGFFTDRKKKEKDILKKIHEHQDDIQHIKEEINHQFYGIEDMF